MRPSTPGNQGYVSRASASRWPQAERHGDSDATNPPDNEPDTVRDTIDAWPDSGTWPESPKPLPSFSLEDVDDADLTEKDFGWDELPYPGQAGSWSPPRLSSVAPHALEVSDEADRAVPAVRSRRRRLVAAIAAVCAAPFLVLGVYAMATRGLGLWTEVRSAAVADGQDVGPHPGGLNRLTPQEQAYRQAGDALNRVATRASSACSGRGIPPASLWVTVTFGVDGRVGAVVIEGSPPDRPGVGECVERIVREATISPFRGDDVQVARAVLVE